ncbi:DUF5134 domain-containing protein [Actinokineospora xionganensis]|uniref:DUF5134 domain-containing protein n=1 Tax=Actinokineospora xionganensis TaxID=2684470 RepID=A0ABR7L2B9_9PSEU|nr:DUF5134 domain-containing protein [Actinokineospora xionganensis]MBC6446628.1 DUF5134 domain-containing protein [Actinokineospora xionganensis]
MATWLGWTCTAAFLAVAGYAVARLVVACRTPGSTGCHRTVDTAHALMALGMAVMCSPVGGPLPMAGWQTVFLLLTVWFLVRREPVSGWHGGGLHHAVGGLAMLYMLTAVPHSAHAMASAWSPRMAGEQAALPVLGWIFVGYFAVQAARLVRVSLRSDTHRVAAGCQGVMAVGAGGMILAML